MFSDTHTNNKSCVSVHMLFTYLLLLILIHKQKCPVLEKTFSPLTKHNFVCALNFPAKFTDVLYITFYGFNAHKSNIKCAYSSLYNEKPLLHIN